MYILICRLHWETLSIFQHDNSIRILWFIDNSITVYQFIDSLHSIDSPRGQICSDSFPYCPSYKTYILLHIVETCDNNDEQCVSKSKNWK